MAEDEETNRRKVPVDIDLDSLGDPPTDLTADSQFLHSDAFDQVLRISARAVDGVCQGGGQGEKKPAARRPESLDVLDDRRHDTVLVSARRGEGKTTLLVRFLKSIETGRYETRPQPGNSVGKFAKLYSLGLIDPTVIENKQNIVIAVVERIWGAVCHVHEHGYGAKEDRFEIVERALRRLATGLKLLDGVGGSLHEASDWEDADFIMDVGLNDASGAYYLKRHLRVFVKEATSYLDCHAFVLAIDDADTLFERGWPVLEALRKYLGMPWLRVVLSGDLDLYTALVRRKQWEQVGKEFLDAEERLAKVGDAPSRIRSLGWMVGELQDQYLVKLLLPENRVYLSSLAMVSEASGIRFHSKGSADLRSGEGMDAQEFAGRFADRLLGLRTQAAATLIKQRLLGLPTRSAVQVLSGAKALVGMAEPRVEESNGAKKRVGVAKPTDSAWQEAIDQLLHVATSALLGFGLSPKDVRDFVDSANLPRLAAWLTSSETWRKFSRFYPDAVDDEAGNLSSLFLGAFVYRVFARNPGTMVEYWLRIGLVWDWLDHRQYDDKTLNATAEELYRFLGVRAGGATLQLVSHFAAWDMAQDDKLGIRLSGANIAYGRIRGKNAAMLELYGQLYSSPPKGPIFNRDRFAAHGNNHLDLPIINFILSQTRTPYPMRRWHQQCLSAGWTYRVNKETGFEGYFVNTIDSVIGRMSGSSRRVAGIPLQQVVSSQASAFGSYSFLRLISVIGDLIALVPTLAPGSADLKTAIGRLLNGSTALRRYPMPTKEGASGMVGETFSTEESEEGEDDDDDLTELTDQLSDEDRLIEVLARWLEHHHESWENDSHAVAPVVLARIWTRFSYAFDSVCDGLVHLKSRYLGILFHRVIITFLHAVGLEAARARDFRLSQGVQNNPVTSGAVFVTLLDSFADENRPDMGSFDGSPEKRFFYLLFSCPLWGFFLARDEGDELDKKRPKQPNDEIFKKYLARVSAFGANETLWKVRVVEPGKSGRGADFLGLFHVLNTVYLQGQSSAPIAGELPPQVRTTARAAFKARTAAKVPVAANRAAIKAARSVPRK